MNNVKDKKQKQIHKPGLNTLLFLVLVFSGLFAFQNINTGKATAGQNDAETYDWRTKLDAIRAELAHADVTDLKGIKTASIEEITNEFEAVGYHGKMIIEKNFTNSITDVEIRLAILWGVLNIGKCYDNNALDDLCRIWRLVNRLTGSRNKIVRGLGKNWVRDMKDLIDQYTRMCDNDFDIEEHCK